MNHLLNLLPERYLRRKTNGLLKTNYQRPTIAEMNAVDPSEAARSGEILGLLPAYFRIIERHDYGGTLLHLLFEDIAGNFREDRPDDMRVLNMLFEVEDVFLEIGEIPSDFAVVIAKSTDP